MPYEHVHSLGVFLLIFSSFFAWMAFAVWLTTDGPLRKWNSIVFPYLLILPIAIAGLVLVLV